MNTTVLALQEEQVLVAVGKSGAQPSVQALYSAPAHGGGMENWEKAIGALWQQHRLPTRGITLVLPDEAVATKTITAPSMPENKLEELVRHEMRPREDQLAAADYVPLGTDAEGRQQLFCAACRKETMEEYLAMTDRLGLRLQSVTVTMAGRLKLLHAMQSMQGKTCIWLCFEGSSVLSLLVENGEYRYSSRSRIFSEPGTVDFGTEMTRDVSGTMQFHTASRSGGTLTDVYYAGCSDDDFEVCLAGIRGLGLKVSRLPECRVFRALPNGERLSDWLGCAEALIRTVLRANKELDLLRSYRRLSRGSKGQTGLLHSFYTPIAVCLVVCAAVWCVFLQMNSSLSHRTDDINDWLNDPTVIEQYNEAAEKQQRNDNLVQGLQQLPQLCGRELAGVHLQVQYAAVHRHAHRNFGRGGLQIAEGVAQVHFAFVHQGGHALFQQAVQRLFVGDHVLSRLGGVRLQPSGQQPVGPALGAGVPQQARRGRAGGGDPVLSVQEFGVGGHGHTTVAGPHPDRTAPRVPAGSGSAAGVPGLRWSACCPAPAAHSCRIRWRRHW